jgi:cytochrome b6-f complex iron-sulfur subunit
MNTTKEDRMKRGEFLRSLGLSTSTLMAFYCLGTTMTSCGSKTDDPDPGDGGGGGGGGTGLSGTTTGSAINFTVDISNSNYSSLKTAGSYKIIGDVLVAFTSGSTYVALAKNCTHEGTELQYRKAENDLLCSNHGSEFSTTGAVENGPNTGDKITALKAYRATLGADGKTLTVTA